MHGDDDGWSVADILNHDVRLLDAHGQAKFFTGNSKPIYTYMKVLCGVGRKRSIISKEKFTNETLRILLFAFRGARMKSLPSDLMWM